MLDVATHFCSHIAFLNKGSDTRRSLLVRFTVAPATLGCCISILTARRNRLALAQMAPMTALVSRIPRWWQTRPHQRESQPDRKATVGHNVDTSAVAPHPSVCISPYEDTLA